jgi:hypothetical protein
MPRYATRAAERSKYPTPSIQTRFWPNLDPAQREQLQDEDTWIARQLFVGDLIDQILAAPPETIT